MRALLVVNPQSRRGRRLDKQVRHELGARGITIAERSNVSGVDCIVVAGGDGTFARWIERARTLGVPMGIVPAGTFNELARTLGIPLDVGGACAVIAAGRTRAIDVARVNGVYYVNEASIGASSRIARMQRPEDKQRFGFLAIVASALHAFRHSRPISVEVAFDGRTERFKTIQLTVANSNRFGGLFAVDDASIDDGWLDLYSIEIHNFAQAFCVARAIFAGKREAAPGLRTYRAASFTVGATHGHRISADGEPAGRTPATFEILPKALRVFVP